MINLYAIVRFNLRTLLPDFIAHTSTTPWPTKSSWCPCQGNWFVIPVTHLCIRLFNAVVFVTQVLCIYIMYIRYMSNKMVYFLCCCMACQIMFSILLKTYNKFYLFRHRNCVAKLTRVSEKEKTLTGLNGFRHMSFVKDCLRYANYYYIYISYNWQSKATTLLCKKGGTGLEIR